MKKLHLNGKQVPLSLWLLADSVIIIIVIVVFVIIVIIIIIISSSSSSRLAWSITVTVIVIFTVNFIIIIIITIVSRVLVVHFWLISLIYLSFLTTLDPFVFLNLKIRHFWPCCVMPAISISSFYSYCYSYSYHAKVFLVFDFNNLLF